jgi:site-specific DNA recombinase
LPPIRVENAWPSIVDKDTFAKVQVVLKERAPLVSHPRRTASPFLLSGIAKCGYCGKALIGNDAKSGKFSYYVCGTLLKKGAKSCQSPYLNSEVFESLVVTKIKQYILTEENLCDLVRLVNEEMDAASVEWRKQLNAITEEIADVERRLNRLYEVLEIGKLSLDDLSERIHHLKNRRDLLHSKRWELEWQLKDRKVELADSNIVKRYVEDLRNLLTDSKFSEKRAFIRSFVKEVNVQDKKATLTYTIPMPPKGITSEEIQVLPIVHYGGR